MSQLPLSDISAPFRLVLWQIQAPSEPRQHPLKMPGPPATHQP